MNDKCTVGKFVGLACYNSVNLEDLWVVRIIGYRFKDLSTNISQ